MRRVRSSPRCRRVRGRAGRSRRALLSGLLLLGLASLAFGFSHHVLLLDAARFVQGVAGALAWAGALTWVILSSPETRRGSVIGDILGVAVAGSLLGPAIGALAESVGTEVIFSSVLVVTVALALVALRIPEPKGTERQPLSEVKEAMLRPTVLRATWYVAAPSAMFGVVEVLVPLRIDELGGGAGLVAAGFTAGAAIEAILSPAVGRVSDRVGRLRPYALGMLISFPGGSAAGRVGALGVVFAILIVVSVGAGLCFTPALAMLSDAAEAPACTRGSRPG